MHSCKVSFIAAVMPQRDLSVTSVVIVLHKFVAEGFIKEFSLSCTDFLGT